VRHPSQVVFSTSAPCTGIAQRTSQTSSKGGEVCFCRAAAAVRLHFDLAPLDRYLLHGNSQHRGGYSLGTDQAICSLNRTAGNPVHVQADPSAQHMAIQAVADTIMTRQTAAPEASGQHQQVAASTSLRSQLQHFATDIMAGKKIVMSDQWTSRSGLAAATLDRVHVLHRWHTP
jgi:hypothetical protein